jgi:adenine C2-methylase RlmN of 23S rRNA A2503 and tRNA A37
VEGKTSKLACAHELGKLCSRRDLVVTLVPFIKASKDEKLRCSSVKSINEFKATVASYGVQCAVRLSAGSDIRYSVVLKTEAETQLLSESGTGAERSEFWKELDSVKKESRIKRRQTRKMADEDESSMASDIAPVALEQTAFNVLLAGHGGSDRYEMGIESLELDASDEDLPEMFLSSSQELNMVLSGGMLFEDSFDDLCEIDPALDVSPSKNSLRARDRTIPSPNSLLDRVSFLDGLEDAEIHVSMPEIDAFYKALHQMDYPPIDEFIQLYDDSGKTAATMAETRRLMVPPEVLKFALDPLNGFVTMSTKIHSSKKSVDSQSFRLYIQLQDEYVVETMVMRYAVDDKQYASISVSTQVSSPIGLSGNFNLQTSEIVEQIVHASRTLALNREMGQPAEIIGKVSFLGCGEPLLNYDNLVDACFFMAEKPMWNINKDRMTVSTIGITPRIFDLTRDLPQVNIALDLRAPTQNLRSAVVPLAQRYSLDGLMEALDNHMRKYTVSDRTSILDNDTRREKVIIVYTMGKCLWDVHKRFVVATSSQIPSLFSSARRNEQT